MITLIVRYRAYFGKVQDIKEIVCKFIGGFRKQKGVLAYEIYQDERDDHIFLHLIKFEDEASEKEHRNSLEVKKFSDELYPFCQTEPTFKRLVVVG